jgi:hypothetical protein
MQNEITNTPNQQDAMLSMIERIACDPNSDITKFEKLMDMQERLLDKSNEQAFWADFAEMQSELPIIAETTKGHNSNYAAHESIMQVVKPILHKYGFGITFDQEETDGAMKIITILAHRLGHKITYPLTLPLDTSGSKTAVMSIGSTQSYGRRYGVTGILNISTGEDTDGVAPPAALEAPKGLSKVQVASLRGALTKAKLEDIDEAYLCHKAHVTTLADIHPDRFAGCLEHIAGKVRAAKAAASEESK